MIDIPTFIAYTAALCAMIGALFLFFWLRGGRAAKLFWFSLPFLMGACGGVALVEPWPAAGLWGLRLGVCFVLLAYGFGWQAVRALYDRPVAPIMAIGPTVVWFALSATVFEAWDLHGLSASMRALVIAVFNGLAAYELWRSRDEPLPSRPILFGVFAIYAAISASRAPFASILPGPLGAAPTEAWAVVTYNLAAVTEALLASAFMIAISRERIALQNYQLALRDPLTGAYNRRAYQEHLESLEGRARAMTPRIALLLFDIDRFKAINDQYGHATGDKVIVLAAQAAARSLRSNDVIFRVGGEEFACLLRDAADEEALAAAERVRTTFQAIAERVDDAAVNATMSIGVATCQRAPHLPLEQLLEAADKALYEAKRSGRNRTVLADGVFADMQTAGSGEPA